MDENNLAIDDLLKSLRELSNEITELEKCLAGHVEPEPQPDHLAAIRAKIVALRDEARSDCERAVMEKRHRIATQAGAMETAYYKVLALIDREVS